MWEVIPGSPSREVKRGEKEGSTSVLPSRLLLLVASPARELRVMVKNTVRARRLGY